MKNKIKQKQLKTNYKKTIKRKQNYRPRVGLGVIVIVKKIIN